MRTSLRVGMLIGGAGSVALSVLQARIGLVVAPCLVIAGIISGLAVAKWLDRPSYGRQLEEGGRAGLLACGLPGFVALLSLLVAGPRDIATLAASSRFFSLDFSPLVQQLSPLGWAGIDVLTLVSSAITGLVWSAVLVQLFAWSKTGRAARAVRQARLTAAAVQRADQANIPVLAAPVGRADLGALVAIGAPVAATKGATVAPVPVAAIARRAGAVAPSGAQQPAVMRMSPPMAPAVAPQPFVPAATPQQYMPSLMPQPYLPPQELVAPAAPPAQQGVHEHTNRPPRGKTSAARRMESRLNQQMREALEAWAAQEDGADADGATDEPAASSSKRAPKPSTFLNSERDAQRPAKRNRKKNQTRDWLC
jgi:hypothetical protein